MAINRKKKTGKKPLADARLRLQWKKATSLSSLRQTFIPRVLIIKRSWRVVAEAAGFARHCRVLFHFYFSSLRLRRLRRASCT